MSPEQYDFGYGVGADAHQGRSETLTECFHRLRARWIGAIITSHLSQSVLRTAFTRSSLLIPLFATSCGTDFRETEPDAQATEQTDAQPSPPVGTTLTSNIELLSAGEGGACLSSDSTISCWGDSGFPFPPDFAGVTRLSCSRRTTCVLRGDVVECFGVTGNGNGPSESKAFSSVTAFEAGVGGACVIEGGRLDCFGYNADGRFDISVIKGSPLTLSRTQGTHRWVRTSAGWECMGSTNDRRTDEKAPCRLPAGFVPEEMGAGTGFSCGLSRDRVVCWGVAAIDITALAGKKFRGLTVGVGHACFFENDRAVCVGDDRYGQSSVPDAARQARAIQAGSFHTCAVLQNGSISCWGKVPPPTR